MAEKLYPLADKIFYGLTKLGFHPLTQREFNSSHYRTGQSVDLGNINKQDDKYPLLGAYALESHLMNLQFVRPHIILPPAAILSYPDGFSAIIPTRLVLLQHGLEAILGPNSQVIIKTVDSEPIGIGHPDRNKKIDVLQTGLALYQTAISKLLDDRS